MIFDTLREWATVLSTFRNFKHLDDMMVVIQRTHKSSWILHLLRSFLPPKLTLFTSTCHHDFLLLHPPSSILTKSVIIEHNPNEQLCLALFFRAPARRMQIKNGVSAIALHGPCERNEAVESDDNPQVKRTLLCLLNRCLRLSGFAKDAGFSSVLFRTELVLPNRTTQIEDKLVVQWAEVPAEEEDPQAPFKAGAQAGEVILPLKAE
ncbi:MSP domain-containing protein [Aphelenchoides fujianensis]|nr:MSP domain-containing protein [Aphelenchoides fujianensis]KAI6218385.1 MSP domain-containing protein [Aphelenchoides fujianensis]